MSVCLHACMCTAVMPGTLWDQKRALEFLELELGWLCITMWVLLAELRLTAGAASALNSWIILSSCLCPHGIVKREKYSILKKKC